MDRQMYWAKYKKHCTTIREYLDAEEKKYDLPVGEQTLDEIIKSNDIIMGRSNDRINRNGN